LKGPNHKIIADSGEGYKIKDQCKAGIDAVKRIVPNADLVDLTKAA
jgi:uncharacterized protein YegP (UPF0339 family)